MNDYGFKPSMLFFFALNEDGTENENDDDYSDNELCSGNSNWGDSDYEDVRVEWNNLEHADYDLRIWFYDEYSDDDWTDCRYNGRESHVTGEEICYTTEALKHA